MLACMQEMATREVPPFGVATGEQLAEFNAVQNARGVVFRVLVADSGQFSEGTSFRAVRRLYIADVPTSAAMFQQQCGRVSRMFGHGDLSPDERLVRVVMPIAILPQWIRHPLGAWAYHAFSRDSISGHMIEQQARELIHRLKRFEVFTLEELKEHVDTELSYVSPAEDGTIDVAAMKAQILIIIQQWGLSKHDNPHKCCRDNQTRSNRSTWHLRTLIRAICKLHLDGLDAVSPSVAIETADEIALNSLAASLKVQRPALLELRAGALDCGPIEPTQVDDNGTSPCVHEDTDVPSEWDLADDSASDVNECNESPTDCYVRTAPKDKDGVCQKTCTRKAPSQRRIASSTKRIPLVQSIQTVQRAPHIGLFSSVLEELQFFSSLAKPSAVDNVSCNTSDTVG